MKPYTTTPAMMKAVQTASISGNLTKFHPESFLKGRVTEAEDQSHLHRLSNELIELIAENLNNNDLLKFRTVSGRLSLAVDRLFVKRFFEVWRVFPDDLSSLQTFLQVSESRFKSLIRTVKILADDSLAPEHVIDLVTLYTTAEATEIMDILTRTLLRLDKCTSICLDFDRLPIFTKMAGRRVIPNQYWTTTSMGLAAAVKCGPQIQEMALVTSNEAFCLLNMPQGMAIEDEKSRSSIQSLRLYLVEEDLRFTEMNSAQRSAKLKMLPAFEGISKLHVTGIWYNGYDHTALLEILRKCRFSKLRDMTLSTLKTYSIRYLLQAVYTHGPKLQSLVLKQILARNDRETSWLTHLYIKGIGNACSRASRLHISDIASYTDEQGTLSLAKFSRLGKDIDSTSESTEDKESSRLSFESQEDIRDCLAAGMFTMRMVPQDDDGDLPEWSFDN